MADRAGVIALDVIELVESASLPPEHGALEPLLTDYEQSLVIAARRYQVMSELRQSSAAHGSEHARASFSQQYGPIRPIMPWPEPFALSAHRAQSMVGSSRGRRTSRTQSSNDPARAGGASGRVETHADAHGERRIPAR